MLSAVQTAHRAYQAAAELAPSQPLEPKGVWIIPEEPADPMQLEITPHAVAIAGCFLSLIAGGLFGAWLQL